MTLFEMEKQVEKFSFAMAKMDYLYFGKISLASKGGSARIELTAIEYDGKPLPKTIVLDCQGVSECKLSFQNLSSNSELAISIKVILEQVAFYVSVFECYSPGLREEVSLACSSFEWSIVDGRF